MNLPTTHVGSLPRPDELIKRQTRKETISNDDITRYTAELVERQLAAGLTSVNNGEMPRTDYIDGTFGRLSGFDGSCTAPLPRDMEELPAYSRRFGGRNGLITLNPKAPIALPACTAEVGYTGSASLTDELELLTAAYQSCAASYPGTSLFFTTPSPGTVALFHENQHYRDYQSYLQALGGVLREEYQLIANHGVDLQVDCPDLAMGRHTAYKEMSDGEYIELIEMNISVLNDALANIDPARCRVHICWGNYPGTHHCDVHLDTIFDSMIKINARYISLESCNHRHAHEWELLKTKQLPDDKVLMPGVIDTTSNTVEHPDLVSERLLDFVSILGPERVIGSTDCGFASTAGAASVTGEVAWLKLDALVEGAARASRRL